MAVTQATNSITLVAGEDLRDKQFHLLEIVEFQGIGVVKLTGQSSRPSCVLSMNPNENIDTNGLGVPVALLQGVFKVKSFAGITAGQYVMPSQSVDEKGTVTGVDTIYDIPIQTISIGIALETVSAGAVFEVFAQITRYGV